MSTDPKNSPAGNSDDDAAARIYSTPAPGAPTLPAPGAPVTPAAGTEAERFLAAEVAEAKRSLMITRIVSAVASLFVLFYLGYITSRFQESMKPAVAAEIAKGLVAERVDTGANEFADEMKKRVPAFIEGLPDYALKEMPGYRQKLEDRIITDLNGYSAENAPKLGEHLDDFLTAHKDEVKEMIDAGQDSAVADKVGAQLEAEFIASLKETDAGGGETFKEKMDKSLVSLQDIHKKVTRLAANKGLTPSEKKTRRAIAILTGKIEGATATNETRAVSEGAAGIRKAVGDATP